MRMRSLFLLYFCWASLTSYAQTTKLTKQEVVTDIEALKKILDENSSYVYLNGYDINEDLDRYQRSLPDAISLEEFGLFLGETIGKIGDRHASVRGYRTQDSLYLPLIFAPEKDKVLVLHRDDKNLAFLQPSFPYLKAIDGVPYREIVQKALPEEVTAPKASYFTRAVRELRDIQKVYGYLQKPLPNELKITLSDSLLKNDTTLTLSPVERKKTFRPWDERLESAYLTLKDEEYNKTEILDQLFRVEDKIGYILLPSMVSQDDAPNLFSRIETFMKMIQKDSRALIIDVRNNGGGTRDLTYALAKYLVHPDSIYVVNATRQRGPLPLPEDYIESLHARYLFAYAALDYDEQQKVVEFLKTFKPMYQLEDTKYSAYYFGLLHGKKLASKSMYYDRPVYILANEKSFSAASVFVSIFKGLPHVRIVGMPTDGSSGNSERFELPNSALRIKLSTMVSFQKDGKILDGLGTQPDIRIERDKKQILWKTDAQLEKLRELVVKQEQQQINQ
ncbi:S41 family peptidase [Sphingobacterium bambusae]